MDSTGLHQSRPNTYKRSFDDLDTGEASTSGLGIPFLVEGEDTTRRERHKRARSESSSSPRTSTRLMHLPEPIARPQTSDTIPSVITAQITSGPADSQSLDTEIAEAMEVDMSINMPGDQGPSEIGIFLESPSFSPPPGPSTHASASTSGALTPPDVLEDISSGGEQFPAQAVSSLFAPLEVPSSPTRSIRPVALESNDEDRFRLSMERFSTFDGHISVLRDPEGPASLPSLLSSETDYSHLGVDGSAPSRVEPDDATWSNITFDSPHAPSLFARLSASALSTGATEGSRRPDLSHADRELAPERVTSDAEPALPRHPFSISREPAPNEHGSEPLEPYDRVRRLITEDNIRRLRHWSGVDAAEERSQQPRSSSYWLSNDTSDRQIDDTHRRAYVGAPPRTAERTRDNVSARLHSDAIRTGFYNVPPSQSSNYLDDFFEWPSQDDRSLLRSVRGRRSLGDEILPPIVLPPPSYYAQLYGLEPAPAVPEMSRHRRRGSDSDEAEAAWLFNEMEDRYHAANSDPLSQAPARPNSPVRPARDVRPLSAASASIVSGISSDTTRSDSVRRRLPRLPMLDDDEDIWGRAPTRSESAGGDRVEVPPLPERQRAQRYLSYDPQTERVPVPRPLLRMPPPRRSYAVGVFPPPVESRAPVRRFVRFNTSAPAESASEGHPSRDEALQERYRHLLPSSAGTQLPPLIRSRQATRHSFDDISRPPSLLRHTTRNPLDRESQSSRTSTRTQPPGGAEEDEVEALLSSINRANRFSADPGPSLMERLCASRQADILDTAYWRTRELLERRASIRDNRPTAQPTRSFDRGLRGDDVSGSSSLAEDWWHDMGFLDSSTVPASEFRSRPPSTGSLHGMEPAAPNTSTAQTASSARTSNNGINLNQYHNGPFRDSLARSERLRRERQNLEVRQGITARRDTYHRATDFLPNSVTATSMAGEGPIDTSDLGHSRATGASTRSTTPNLFEVFQLPSRPLLPPGRATREEQREVHDSITRRLRTPAARLPGTGYPPEVERDTLPSLLPDAAANSRRQRQLIENYRTQRTANNSGNRTRWGDIDESTDHLPWRSHTSRYAVPVARALADDSNVDRSAAGRPSRRGWSIRRRMADGTRASGDYVRDEDFDPSYEGLLRLTSTIGEARPRGTPRTVIDGLPSGVYTEWATAGSEQRCPICLDDYDQADPVLKVPKCSHWFHKGCLEQWLGSASTCPVCRGPIDPNATNATASASTSRPFVRHALRARRDRGPHNRTILLPSTAPAPVAIADPPPPPGPSNNATERRDEDLDMFDDDERDLLIRSLRLLRRRERDT